MSEILQQIQRRCAERCLIFEPSQGATKISPGVYLFEAYDTGNRRIKRYKGISKGQLLHIEDY